MYEVNSRPLNDNANVPLAMTNYAIANGATARTQAINVSKNTGFLVIRIQENHAGGTGSVSVYAEYSDDNVNWDRPYTTDLAGTITQEGNIVTALINVTRRIIHTARLARYVRYAIVAAADSVVTVSMAYQEQL